MRPSSRKTGGTSKRSGTKKKRAKRLQSQRHQNTLKFVIFALATRLRRAGTTRPDADRPTARPIAAGKIKGHGFGPGGNLLCALIGNEVNDAVDAMEQAIIDGSDAKLEKAIEGFQEAWDRGHNSGCWFTYHPYG